MKKEVLKWTNMKPSITSDSNNQEAPPLPNTQDKYKIH